ncbi:MAG: lysylphosphatidylglycerol synthase transmembrane domain-containing protein [Candidatus Diapherotrites archaeon]
MRFPVSKLLPLIGLALFALILLNIGVELVFNALLKADPLLLGLAILVTFFSIFLKAFKWQMIAKAAEFRISSGKAFRYWLVGFFYSAVTPGRIGDFVRAFLARNEAGSLAKSFFSVLADRLIDVAILLLLSIASAALIAQLFGVQVISIAALAAFALALILAFYFFKKEERAKKILKPFFSILVPQKFRGLLRDAFSETYKELAIAKKRKPLLAVASLTGLISMIVSFLAFYLIALSLGISIDPLFFFLCMPLVMIVDLLPVSFSGIGTRDLLLIYLFSLQAISANQAVAFSFLYLAFGYILIAFVGFLFSLKEKIDLNIGIGGENNG